MVPFGQQLRALRLLRGLVQVDLAAKCDVREVTVSRWERGLEFPRGEALKKIALALHARILIDDSGASIETLPLVDRAERNLVNRAPEDPPPAELMPPADEGPSYVASLAFLLMMAKAVIP